MLRGVHTERGDEETRQGEEGRREERKTPSDETGWQGRKREDEREREEREEEEEK